MVIFYINTPKTVGSYENIVYIYTHLKIYSQY